ncbi:hypothetical protein U5640_16330 [Streptomyces sp. SS7]|uniref:hypothetical protein n=1 Tax=Streptomyces sp. SS7 TaxID=3108485 RepID=UPI0030ECEAD8
MTSFVPRRRPAVLAMSAAALLLAPCATAAETSAASTRPPLSHSSARGDGQRPAAGQVGGQAARFKRQLTKSGYVSQSGTEAVFDLDKRYCEGAVFSALWANPQSPYIVTRLPEVQGQAPNTNPPVTWRLRQDEAVVMIGRTPPPEAYFSFDVTMMKGALPTGPLLWPSVGDPVNNKTVRTTGSTPYDRPFALVVTGHRQTRAKVNKMLAASGLRGAINNMTIPPAMFRLGLDKRSDQFLIGMRTAVPKRGYEKALDDYRAAPPIQVFRVRPKSGSSNQTKPVYAPDPLPVPRLRVSGTGATELNLNPSLQLLRRRIIKAHPGYKVSELVVRRGFEESYPGFQQKLLTDPPVTGVDALSNDADDPITPSFKLPNGSFLVAYGTNHVSTRQASYSSITLYGDPKAAVSLTSKNHEELRGSAHHYLSDKGNADKFYAWTFSRAGQNGPTGRYVTQLPSTGADYCARFGLHRPVDTSMVQFAARVYMQPGTHTRPAFSSLLMDRMLLFTPK